jgi:hypothetical protein
MENSKGLVEVGFVDRTQTYVVAVGGQTRHEV